MEKSKYADSVRVIYQNFACQAAPGLILFLNINGFIGIPIMEGGMWVLIILLLSWALGLVIEKIFWSGVDYEDRQEWPEYLHGHLMVGKFGTAIILSWLFRFIHLLITTKLFTRRSEFKGEEKVLFYLFGITFFIFGILMISRTKGKLREYREEKLRSTPLRTYSRDDS